MSEGSSSGAAGDEDEAAWNTILYTYVQSIPVPVWKMGNQAA